MLTDYLHEWIIWTLVIAGSCSLSYGVRTWLTTRKPRNLKSERMARLIAPNVRRDE